MIYTILLFMLFLHIVDDYYLQGILASMKQKKWWEDKIPNLDKTIYSKDYIVALIMHGFSWSFLIFLPIIIMKGFVLTPAFVLWVVVNGLIHSFIDDLKANKGKINLWYDQYLHLIQIVTIWITFI